MAGSSDDVVLLLEDEVLIAIDIEDALQQAVYQNVISIASRDLAQAWLEERTPNIAIVDPILRDGVCIEIVRTLAEKKVPLIIHSGERPEHTDLEFGVHQGRWIVKPSRPEDLIEAVQIELAKARSA